MNQHTPEPWVFIELQTSVGKCYRVGSEAIAKGDHGGMCLYDDHTQLNPHVAGEQEANARRIVACVNSCVGIPTSRLENGSADILAFSQELHKQRDELLQLLSVAMCPNCDGSGAKTFQNSHGDAEQEQCQWCDEKNAAIAKAEQS